MSQPRPQVLGVEITPGTHDDLLNQIRTHLSSGEGLLHVVTANPEYVMSARKDAEFAESIREGGIVTVDGAGLAVAMKLLHPEITSERYTGVQLSMDCAQLSADTGMRLFLLGAGLGVADEAARRLKAEFPGANIVGTWSDGSPRAEHDAETIQRLHDAKAEILLVAYGAPGQIYWIHRNFAALQVAGVQVVSGIGGALDYISGNVKWAPPLVRKFGMEWLYRLVREPHRWRRQLVLPQFAVLMLAEFVQTKFRRGVE